MKKFTIIFFLIFISIFSFSQSILWKISGKKMKAPSYLYGTIHIQNKRVFNFDTTVTNAFESCASFAMEILMDKIDPKVLQDAMVMKNNSLDNLLSENEYKIADSIFHIKMGTGLSIFNKLKPFFLSSMVETIEIAQDMDTPLDLYFLRMAKNQGKTTCEVEKFTDQIKAIDAISEEEQAGIFYEAITNTDNNEDYTSMEDLINYYLAFNLDKILELTKEEDVNMKNFEKIFITERNKTMAKNLHRIIKKQSCFCAIGVAHLPGQNGVIELLRKSGYTVEAVPFKWNN